MNFLAKSMMIGMMMGSVLYAESPFEDKNVDIIMVNARLQEVNAHLIDIQNVLTKEQHRQCEAQSVQMHLIYAGLAWFMHTCVPKKMHAYIKYVSWTHTGIASLVGAYKIVKLWQNKEHE